MLRLQEGLNAGVARCAGWVAAQRDIAIPAPHQPSCPGAPPCPGPRGPPVPLVTCAVCPSGFPYEKVVQRVLYLQVLDYDRFSRNDPIGEVSIPLNKVDLTQMQTFWKDLKPCSDGSVRPQLQAPGGGLAARADRYRPSHPQSREGQECRVEWCRWAASMGLSSCQHSQHWGLALRGQGSVQGAGRGLCTDLPEEERPRRTEVIDRGGASTQVRVEGARDRGTGQRAR